MNNVVPLVSIISSGAIGLKIAMLGGTKIDSAQQKATLRFSVAATYGFDIVDRSVIDPLPSDRRSPHDQL
jgi:hypothetical protein